jgi:hypothetical protein
MLATHAPRASASARPPPPRRKSLQINSGENRPGSATLTTRPHSWAQRMKGTSTMQRASNAGRRTRVRIASNPRLRTGQASAVAIDPERVVEMDELTLEEGQQCMGDGLRLANSHEAKNGG